MTFTASAVLMLKVILDSVSRILLFSSWLYVINHGVFSSVYTLIAYYLVFAVLVIFNLVFNDDNNFSSGKYWLGFTMTYLTYIIIIMIKFIFTFAGIVLNSLSSILSYNSFNVDQMFGQSFIERRRMKKSQKNKRHQKTFLKQLAYFIIMVILYLW